MIVIGLDCGSDSVVGCKLSEMPSDLVSFANKYKPIKAKADRAGVEKLAAEGDIFILEPTGSYYLFWVEELQVLGKTVLLVSGTRIRHFAIQHGLQKSDREDGVAIAAFGLDNLNRGNTRAFIQPPAGDLRDLYLAMRSVRHSRCPIVNRMRSRLGREAPALAKVQTSEREWLSALAPPLYRAIASGKKPTRGKRVQAGWEEGRTISTLTRELAEVACKLEQIEYAIELEMAASLDRDRADWMAAVLNEWTIPDKQQAILLSVALPFEQFLAEDGKRITDKVWNQKGDRQNRRDRSLKRWKRVFACGTKRIQSGDKTVVVQIGDKQLASEFRQLLDSKVVILRQPQAKRILKRFEMPEDTWAGMSDKQQAAWLAEHSFEAVLKPSARMHDRPWMEQECIQKAQWYNGASQGFAKLQLLFEFGGFKKMKKATVINRKLYPKFMEWLFADLVEAYQKTLNPS